eukprot:Trichotokara_eunicae@DN5920_c0_g1_i4.p1
MRDRDYRRVILVACLLSAFQQLGGINVFIASSNKLFEQAGMDSGTQTMLSTLMTALNVVMTFPSLYLIEKMGRRSLLLMGCIGQTIGMLPATIMYWTTSDEDDDVVNVLAIIGVFVFIFFFAVAYGPVLWVYLFEIFPTEIRGSAAAAATGMNWIASIAMVYLGAMSDENKINYTIFSAMLILSVLIVAFLMKETKGRALEDSPYLSAARRQANEEKRAAAAEA